MKRLCLLLIMVCTAYSVVAQIDDTNLDPYYAGLQQGRDGEVPQDSVTVNTDDIDPAPYQWVVDEKFGTVKHVDVDTAFINFPNYNLNEGATGTYNHTGNLGSPRISRLWIEQKQPTDLFFLDPYSYFYKPISELRFSNSKLPYTNIDYYFAGSRVNSEKRFDMYFSRNAGKRFSVGFDIDYLYAQGYYQNQTNSQFKGSLFGAYLGERYEAKLIYGYYYLKQAENGGIKNDLYITDPEDMAQGTRQFNAREIPVIFDRSGASAWNRNRLNDVYFSHSYNMGFHRTTETFQAIDSLRQDTLRTVEYIPVTAISHTARLVSNKHKFLSTLDTPSDGSFSYANTYLTNNDQTADSTLFFELRNTLSLSLLEGFNKYAKAGLRVFAEHYYRRHTIMPRNSAADPTLERTEQELFVGGALTKQQGKAIHYNVLGSFGVNARVLGDFDITGNGDLNIPFGGDTLTFVAHGRVSNTTPISLFRIFNSNHYRWDKELNREFRTRVAGELIYPRTRTNIGFGIENIQHYTYMNAQALPAQTAGSVQVLNAYIKQNFKLGILHLDNDIHWQHSTDKTILPLPTVNLYHNLYIDALLAKKVLRMQLGIDVRYFTEYYAPTYTPAIGSFHLQNPETAVKVGNYPLISAYANFHLKQARFFLQMYHLNQSTGRYFFVPHYPLNPQIIKFGLSWNFFD